ncbi:MAG: hypothetical protein ACOCQQ_02590 [Candidatus Nanoarchaeia archaeon]
MNGEKYKLIVSQNFWLITFIICLSILFFNVFQRQKVFVDPEQNENIYKFSNVVQPVLLIPINKASQKIQESEIGNYRADADTKHLVQKLPILSGLSDGMIEKAKTKIEEYVNCKDNEDHYSNTRKYLLVVYDPFPPYDLTLKIEDSKGEKEVDIRNEYQFVDVYLNPGDQNIIISSDEKKHSNIFAIKSSTSGDYLLSLGSENILSMEVL